MVVTAQQHLGQGGFGFCGAFVGLYVGKGLSLVEALREGTELRKPIALGWELDDKMGLGAVLGEVRS